MKIRVTRTHQALTPFEWANVPTFAVVTGPNGVGKSQLLYGIHRYFDESRGAVVVLDDFQARQFEVLHRSSEWSVWDPPTITFSAVQERKQQTWQLYKRGLPGAENPARLMGTPLAAAFQRIEKEYGVGGGGLEEDQLVAGLRATDFVETSDFSAQHISQIYIGYRARQADAALGFGAPLLDPPPWRVLDGMLAGSGLPFTANNPEQISTGAPFRFHLTHAASNSDVELSALSSGERVILSTIFWLFGTSEGRLPKLLLLDEPDAHLHPSMTRQFINFVHRVLVLQHGVRVIMTTHSPTTIALSPDDSIFVMDGPVPNSTPPRIRKVSRDAAIGVLTAGLPTLRIDHANRHQIFVESQYDADNYQALNEVVRDHLDPEISLCFLASGKKGGAATANCDSVEFFVAALGEHGVDTVFGIVDWDQKRASTDRVKVLGGGERYALENFLLDPVAVAILLWRERIGKEPIPGLPDVGGVAEVANLSSQKLQAIADFVLERVKAKLRPNEVVAGAVCTVSMIGGETVSLPEWFLHLNGHVLEERVVEAFPGLGRWKQPNQLLSAVIDLVFRDFPTLVPRSVLETLRLVQQR